MYIYNYIYIERETERCNANKKDMTDICTVYIMITSRILTILYVWHIRTWNTKVKLEHMQLSPCGRKRY